MLGADAQVPPAAELSVGTRAEGTTRTGERAARAGPARRASGRTGAQGDVHPPAADGAVAVVRPSRSNRSAA
ncbi:hypothetical protein AQJ58_11710 [Streptomyces sp. DSM 15324]|nr:hypothetical protein AQJ58_11710 [Streptomyces sp. DSM 15324]